MENSRTLIRPQHAPGTPKPGPLLKPQRILETRSRGGPYLTVSIPADKRQSFGIKTDPPAPVPVPFGNIKPPEFTNPSLHPAHPQGSHNPSVLHENPEISPAPKIVLRNIPKVPIELSGVLIPELTQNAGNQSNNMTPVIITVWSDFHNHWVRSRSILAARMKSLSESPPIT